MSKLGMGSILKQAQKMQENLVKAQENLAQIRVEGTAGGGMIKVVANAAQQILEIQIDPEVVDPKEVEMLEDLMLAAVNQALQNGKAKAEEEMSNVTGGMLPNLGGLKLPGF
jgi:DNA-binding YbaB/EbfC family protein